ncbi:MAG: endopeptidase La [Ruminococcus sp.]|nr:endopeptidase La [Ruminococcus sp.]
MNYINNEVLNLPVLPLRGLVVFPKTLLHFDVGRDKSQKAINIAMKRDQQIFLVAQKNPSTKDPISSELFRMGVVANIIQVIKQPDGATRVIVEGQQRAHIIEYIDNEKCLFAQVETISEMHEISTAREVALIRSVKELFETYSKFVPKLSSDVMFKVAMSEDGGELADFITANVVPEYNDKQLILETKDICERLETLIDILNQEIYILEIEDEISAKAREHIDEQQREYFLREQRNIIESELGEGESPSYEADDYIEKIKALKLDDTSETSLIKECRKLSKMPFGSQEAAVIKTYIETVLDLPWNTSTKDKLNLKTVKSKLEKNHYGLTKVKERIIEQLAVRKLNPDIKGQILCLVGPPGVGKTSIAQSVADSIGRKSARIALGGVHDEAEIRGHRRTYIGSMPGRIMAAVKSAGTNNPLLILDEVDKLGSDYKGDPSSALLEVLDAEQNNKFIDHYIDIPFDLSKVFFITTANDASTIPAPLYDRMEIIHIDSYTREEKFNIAKKHLIPKQLKENGLDSKAVKFTSSAIYSMIDSYTKEAGVRRLEHEIAKAMRKFAVIYVNGEETSIKFTDKNISDYLGVKRYIGDKLSAKDEIGIVNGLAWTSVGGTLLPIEVAVMEGTGKINLTGSLGDVMQESAQAAITCIRSHAEMLGIDPDFYKNKDIHIHAPEGAVPKDGPSAGITMTTAIYSALSMRSVKREIAMTGEITLRGKILPIGGLKEKSMAAYKAGVKTVYIPKDNVPDLQELDPVVKEAIKFIPCETFTDVIFNATVEPIVVKEKKNVVLPKGAVSTAATVRQ